MQFFITSILIIIFLEIISVEPIAVLQQPEGTIRGLAAQTREVNPSPPISTNVKIHSKSSARGDVVRLEVQSPKIPTSPRERTTSRVSKEDMSDGFSKSSEPQIQSTSAKPEKKFEREVKKGVKNNPLKIGQVPFRSRWSRVLASISSAKRFIAKQVNEFWRKVKEFFVGNGVHESSGPEIRYANPKEKDEREAIVKEIKALTPEGEAPKDWLEGLDDRFANLPDIIAIPDESEQANEALSLLRVFLSILSKPELTQRQRRVILDCINHLTRYNRFGKTLVIRAANKYPDVFKALAFSISSVRSDGRPSTAVKGSFEADWLSNSSVAERYHRILLVRDQPEDLLPCVKELARGLEKVTDITVWNHPDGTPSDLQLIMKRSLGLFKHQWDHDQRLYLDEIIQYISRVNTEAFDTLVTHLMQDGEYVDAMLSTWVQEHGGDMFETFHEGSIYIDLLSDERVGATLDRKLLDLVIPSDRVLPRIKSLKEDIIGSQVMHDDHSDPKQLLSLSNLLRRAIIGLIECKKEQRLDMEYDQLCYLKMIAYLERRRPGLKYEIYRYLDTEPDLLPILSHFFANKLDDEMDDIQGYSWCSRILREPRYAELILRQKLISRNWTPHENRSHHTLIWVKELRRDWWKPLHSDIQVKKILESVLDTLNASPKKSLDDPEVKEALEVLWHILRFKPSLRETVYTTIHRDSNFWLRHQLRNYVREKLRNLGDKVVVFDSKSGTSINLFQWFSKIKILQEDEPYPESWIQKTRSIASICASTSAKLGFAGIQKGIEFASKLSAG
ncbi:hypothetical protein DFH28DRAFT_328257 [Melampsora americana]|nr:hypothetical protein DFH28DRAFT_328257 [Melampsora americana]